MSVLACTLIWTYMGVADPGLYCTVCDSDPALGYGVTCLVRPLSRLLAHPMLVPAGLAH